MGAYPALAIQQPENPANSISRLVALKGMLQQQQTEQQLNPLRVQEAQNTVAQQNQAIQSQKALQQAYIEANGDIDKVAPLAIKYGARAQDAQAMVNASLEQRQKLSTLTKDQQGIVGTQNKVLGEHSQMLLGITDPAQRQQAYQTQTVPALQQVGIPANQIPTQVPDDMTLKAHSISAMDVDKQLEENRKNTQFAQEHGPIPADKLAQINSALSARYNVLNPGKQLPATYQLPQNATVDDFNRIDKLMEQTEKAQATQAQRDTANDFRAQAGALANLAAQEKVAQLNKPTADEEKRADLARNLQENIGQLSDILQRRPDLFGPVAGRITGLRGTLGTKDPDVAALDNIQHQLGMAQISAHGMRSAGAIAGAADALVNSFHNSPEATKAALESASKSVATFTADEQAARSGARTGITPGMVPGAKKPAQQASQPATALPSNIAAQIQEGHEATLSDGTKWRKVNGQVSQIQ